MQRSDALTAIDCYAKAEALNPLDPLLLSNSGVAWREQGHARAAIRYYRRALQVDPHNADIRFNLGAVLLEAGRLRALQGLLAAAPADATASGDEWLGGLKKELEARKEGRPAGAVLEAAQCVPVFVTREWG